MLESTPSVVREARQALRDVPRKAEVQTLVKTEVGRQMAGHLSKEHKDHVELEQLLHRHFKQHEEVLAALRKHRAAVQMDAAPRGGFPWTLVLLGGLGYYLWSNSQARQKIMALIQQVRPAAEEKLGSASQAIQQVTQQVTGGQSNEQNGSSQNQGGKQQTGTGAQGGSGTMQAGAQGSLTEIDERLERNLRERLQREGDHLQVKDLNGKHVGTVDGIEGDRLKLTRSGSRDGQHHYVFLSQVRGMDDVAVHLSVPHRDMR